MSYYLDNNYSQDYGRRTELYRNYQNNPEKRRTINQNLSSSKIRDNSAILRRAINKKYKEDINKNIVRSDDYDDNDDNNNDYYENNLNNNYNDYRNKNPNNPNNYNNSNNRINYYSNNRINYYSNNKPNYNFNENDNNNYYDQALISRIHNNRIRNNINSNIRNYYNSSGINKDNMYDEFIINYHFGINNEDNFGRNTLNKNQNQFIKNANNYNINNQLYNRKTSNNFFRDKYVLNPNNNNFTNSQIEYIYRPQIENNEDIKVPYHKRRINNYTYKDNKENGMANTNYINISKNKEKLYLRNNLENDSNYNINKLSNFNTFDPSNNYERNYNIINENNDNGNNYENNINNNEDDYINDNYSNQNTDLDLYSKENERISDFLQHVIQYCFLYYFKIIQKVFTFLKNQKNKPEIKKYNKIIPKTKDVNKNINIKNKTVKTTNYLKKYQTYSDIRDKSNLNKTTEKNERFPYHKNNNENNTNNIIERIKSKNESVSPNKNNNVEMYRNFDELNKKYEIINNRKNRMSYNNTKRSLNDLSFNSENRAIYRNSVDKNKEIFENNLNKERERKKKILERKKKQKEKSQIIKEKEKNNLEIKTKNKSEDKTNQLSKLIQKNEELKKRIKKAIQDSKLEVKKDINNNNVNKIPSLERKKIREKYKKKNLNKTNDKYEMIDVKKISTKDKSIYINIKYLNFIPMNNKNKKGNNNKYKLYQVCNNFNISLLAIKDNNGNKKKIKKENSDNNNYFHKLSSIQEENKIDLNELSDSLSHKSEKI